MFGFSSFYRAAIVCCIFDSNVHQIGATPHRNNRFKHRYMAVYFSTARFFVQNADRLILSAVKLRGKTPMMGHARLEPTRERGFDTCILYGANDCLSFCKHKSNVNKLLLRKQQRHRHNNFQHMKNILLIVFYVIYANYVPAQSTDSRKDLLAIAYFLLAHAAFAGAAFEVF